MTDAKKEYKVQTPENLERLWSRTLGVGGRLGHGTCCVRGGSGGRRSVRDGQLADAAAQFDAHTDAPPPSAAVPGTHGSRGT